METSVNREKTTIAQEETDLHGQVIVDIALHLPGDEHLRHIETRIRHVMIGGGLGVRLTMIVEEVATEEGQDLHPREAIPHEETPVLAHHQRPHEGTHRLRNEPGPPCRPE